MIGWAVVVTVLLLRFGQVEWRTHQLLRHAQPVNPTELPVDLERLRQLAHAWLPVRLVTSPAVDAPAVWGLFRPRVIFPPQSVRDLAPNQLLWTLLHELAHVRRGDVIVATVQKLLQIVYFFNPVVWLANWMIDQQREYACDDVALAASNMSRRDCGEAYLSAVERSAGLPTPVATPLGLLNRGTFVRRRLMRILDHKRTIQPGLSAGAGLLLLTVAVVVLPSVRASDSDADQQPGAAADDAKPTSPDSAHPSRRFVRLVVAPDRMTFEGQGTNWEQLPSLLRQVPDRAETVLEIAVGSEDITLRQLNEARNRATSLSAEFGFEYLSYVGLHPLGTMGSPAERASTSNEPALPVSPHRRLLDERTLIEINKRDRSAAAMFVAETRYEAASQSEKDTLLDNWVQAAQERTNLDISCRAIAALGNVADRRAVQTLLTIVQHPPESAGNRPRWLAVRALGRIGDMAAVPVLIDVLNHTNKDTRLYARIALCEITGVYLGASEEDWRRWWNEHGRSLSELDLSSPEATVTAFIRHAAAGNVKLALACFAPDSHDYEDVKAILTGSEPSPMKMLFEAIDPDRPVSITKKELKGDWCSIAWTVTFKRDVTSDQRGRRSPIQPGGTFELDGNLKKVDRRGLIVGL